MRVTTRYFREAVRLWLRRERPTKEQTLQLLDAVHAGTIDGGRYGGNRNTHEGDTNEKLNQVDEYRDTSDIRDRSADARLDDDEGAYCGCLLGTLELIGCARAPIEGVVADAFALALRIPFGAVPTNNAWAKAAANGIEDYYAEKGWR